MLKTPNSDLPKTPRPRPQTNTMSLCSKSAGRQIWRGSRSPLAKVSCATQHADHTCLATAPGRPQMAIQALRTSVHAERWGYLPLLCHALAPPGSTQNFTIMRLAATAIAATDVQCRRENHMSAAAALQALSGKWRPASSTAFLEARAHAHKRSRAHARKRNRAHAHACAHACECKKDMRMYI